MKTNCFILRNSPLQRAISLKMLDGPKILCLIRHFTDRLFGSKRGEKGKFHFLFPAFPSLIRNFAPLKKNQILILTSEDYV